MYPLIQKKKGAFRIDPNAVIAEASFNFNFANRSLVESVSGTSPLTLSRPAQKFHINNSGRYAIAAASATAYHHTAAGVCRGILIEGVSSNYIRNSNVFIGTTGWDGPVIGGAPSGTGGGGAYTNVTAQAALPGPIVGMENAAGYQATRFAMTTTTGQHTVGKYGGTTPLALQQYVIAMRQNGNTSDYALAFHAGGAGIAGPAGHDPRPVLGVIVDASGQVLQEVENILDPFQTFSNMHFLQVEPTSDGWVLVSFIMRTSSNNNNNRNPQIGVVKRSGASWETSFPGDPSFTFDLFGFSREYSSDFASRGAERLYSSYIHSNAATGPTVRAADSLTWSSVPAGLKSAFIEANGVVYDCSLLTIDDNSGSFYVPNAAATDSAPYDPDNLIDFQIEASGGMELYGVYKCLIRRGFEITAAHGTDIFSSANGPHGLSAGMAISFRARPGHTLPSPLVGKVGNAEQLYYVLPTNLTATDFMVSTTIAGSPVDLQSSIGGNVMARVANVITIGPVALNGRQAATPLNWTQRMIISWDSTNVTCGATGNGSRSVAHGLGLAPTVTHLRIGTGYRLNRLADANIPVAKAIGWNRVLTALEQAAVLTMP